MRQVKYEPSRFLSLEGEIKMSGERVIRNTYTGARLEVTREVVEIVKLFNGGKSVRRVADQLECDKGGYEKLKCLCETLIRSTILVMVGTNELQVEVSFRRYLDSNPLSSVSQTFASCPNGDINNISSGEIVLFGVPIDIATSFNPGTRFGPDIFREVSSQYITYERDIFSGLSQGWFNADLGRVVLTGKKMVDIGNIVVRPEDSLDSIYDRISLCANKLANDGALSVVFGGDHSISAPLILSYARCHSELTVLHLDAHTDLASWLPGTSHHHGSFMRRVLCESENTQVYQIGARGFSGEVLASPRYHLCSQSVFDDMFQKGIWESVLPRGKKCYITIDTDVIDPAFAPGVGTPVPFGMDPKKLLSLLEMVSRNNEIVAIDMVEMCPSRDVRNSTSSLMLHLIVSLMAWAWDK